ncbi:MAG TPA: isoprenylcysteine carboxylmethyltransferase family protein [Verrucomicrobiae bacterium]|nr:isoprenylcysteine carboxylmethyltransferase family protein [Verrucomicrobiae bacterium]
MVDTAMTTHTQPPATGPRSSPDAPGVIVFPPVLFVGTLLLGLGIHLLWPMRLAMTPLSVRIIGAVLVVASGALSRWASGTMRRAGTNVLPGKPTLSIVTGGPFRFSRNPLYIAGSVLYLGLTLISNSAWPLVLSVPMLVVLDWGIVRREERYLEAKFGGDYLAYKTRVRRWL